MTLLIAEWLEQASQLYKMYCYDLEVMTLNPGWVELGMHSSVQSRTLIKNIIILSKLT